MEESQLLRDEQPTCSPSSTRSAAPVADGVDRHQALPRRCRACHCPMPALFGRQPDRPPQGYISASPTAPVTARTTLTRWLSGHVPLDVLEGARQLASELVSNSLLRPDISEGHRLGSSSSAEGSLRVREVIGTTYVVAGPEPAPDCERGGEPVLQLVDEIATRWGINHRRDAGVVRGRRRADRHTRRAEVPARSVRGAADREGSPRVIAAPTLAAL